MATATDRCEVCGLEDFILEDGFYYCTECGTKLLNKREIVDDEIDVGGHTFIRTEVVAGIQITSWEQMNYFLHGLTERLIELGAPEELKTTVLQIWCAYLNFAEIAFFRNTQHKRPRLDLKLLFNRDFRKRPKSKAKEPAEMTSRRRRKQTQDMLTAEQNAFSQSQKSDLESMNDPSPARIPLRFQFNSRARKRLQEELKLDEEHIEWHEQQAPPEATCHSFPYYGKKCNTNVDDWSYVHRKSVLFAILYLALNQVSSTIQISDLLRWWEEGHLPFQNLQQFLPEEIDPACYSDTIAHLAMGQTFYECRMLVSLMATDLGIVPIHPDLLPICCRFLSEMALPLDLAPYIAKVISISPAIKQTVGYTYFPKYELHAMKYILFIMKLLFGLDGVIETKLDCSTEKLNESILASSKLSKLFVWHEWQRYVTMRRIILEQLHYPTSHYRTQWIVNRPIDSDLFLSYFQSYAISDDDNMTGYKAGLIGTGHTLAKERIFHSLHTIIASATDKHSNKYSVQSRKHIQFDHSLEPQRSYFAEILNMNDNERQHVYIPEYMLTDHSKRTVAPFVNPMPLKKHILENQKVRLVTKTVKPTVKQIQMVSHKTHFANVVRYLNANKFAHVLHMDDSESSSCEDDNAESNILDYINSKTDKNHLSHGDMLRNTICRNILDELESNLRAADFAIVAKDTDLSWIKELKDEVYPFKNNPAVEEILPDEQRCCKTLPIALPNYYYWVNNTNTTNISHDDFEQRYFSTFPASFQFLLREAAYVTRCSTMELYLELNNLEKYVFDNYSRIK
uniref:TATA box-binding protein-associated factor RNA polymerase I subunit B n=1 Tax=Anopheles funestus TaxID=62324 RepID=A0A182RE36_ANOFN